MSAESDLASEIDRLYAELLRRPADKEGRENALTYLQAGGSVTSLEEAIRSSAEFKAIRKAHPLEDFPHVYRTDLVSWYTHRGKFRPLALTVETVNICNNDCIICPYSAQTRKRGTMTQALFEKVIGDYTAIGGGPISLTPMVGEVFLDKHLLQRLRFLQKLSSVTDVSAITNASMLYRYTDAELSEIVSLFDRLTISVYGLEEDEFRVMTRKKGYAAFRDGAVRLLQIAGADRVLLSARLLKNRTRDAIEAWLTELARDAGIASSDIHFGATSTFSNWGFFDTNIKLPYGAKWKEDQYNRSQCGLPLVSTQIYSDGTVSFCGCADFNADQELMLGDLKTHSLSELLRDPRIERLWDWKRCGVPEFCRKCSFYFPLSDVPARQDVFANPYKEFGG